MKLVLGTYDYPPHPYHNQYIDDSWIYSDINPRHPVIKKVDARKIPYKDIEAIYASHVLEHLESPPEALKHWYEVLRPGGYVHINVPDVEWALDEWMRMNAGKEPTSNYFIDKKKLLEIFDGDGSSDEDTHKSWFTADKLYSLMEKAGFEDIEIRCEYEAHDMGCVIARGYK